MQLHSRPDAAKLMSARLVIHAEADAGTRGTPVGARLQWLRALYSVGARYRKRAPLRLKIEDLHGHPVLAIEDGGPRIELALPAGTYQVTAQVGEERRNYTMTLDQGQSFDLHLRFGSRHPPTESEPGPVNLPTQTRSRLVMAIERRSHSVLFAASLILVVLFGIADYLTGYEIAFSIFYALPIAVVAYFVGRRSALVISLLSALSWLLADAAGHEYAWGWVLYWNTFTRLLFFVVVAVSLDALRNALRHEKELARSDFLTGAANRLAFYEIANKELDRARRYGQPFSLAHIDVDNFKNVNDSLGHQTGDALLCAVVKIMQRHSRDSDTVARLGGDEFVLLLPETGAEDAAIAAKKLHTHLTEEVQRRRWPVSFSVGLLTCLGAPPSVDDMLKSADQLTYLVKERGKNGIKQAVANAQPATVETQAVQAQRAVMQAGPSA